MNDLTRLGAVFGLLACGVIGGAAAGLAGAGAGLLTGLGMFAVRWHGQSGSSWAVHYLRRNQAITLTAPATAANDRSVGGVRYSGGVAVTAVRILGRAHRPTCFAGSEITESGDTLDIAELLPAMRQSLGLVMDSISVVRIGARRRGTAGYAAVYDTLIGPVPYAGRRETWLIVRIRPSANASALQSRISVGTTAVAAAQRIEAALRRRGIRARVATAGDIRDLDTRLACSSLEVPHRRWHTLRGDDGWLTTYSYRSATLSGDLLEQAWSIPADEVMQNVSIFSDGSCTATLTVRSPKPPTAPPSVTLQSIPGEQARALASVQCGPQPGVRGVARRRLPDTLPVAVGASGVLLGTLRRGDRLALPLSDPGAPARIHLAAADPIAKRIIIRLCASGERITLHTRQLRRWRSVTMPGLNVTDQSRPVPGTTVSVVDGTLPPPPRMHTVISVGPADRPNVPGVDVLIAQTGPTSVRVVANGQVHQVDIEPFRAENRYLLEGVH